MKNISAWAIRHPLPPIVLFVVLLFMGIVCFVRLPVTADPDISFPGVFIGIGQPGAAPQELETQVMQKVEGAVAGIGNIDNITSWAVEGQANIFIQFEIGTPIDRAVADVRDAVAKVRVLLPQGIQEPTVQRINADGGPMVLYAVSSSSLTEEELSWFVDNTITKRLLQVTGVAQVQRGGGVNREIRVELDPARMQALGITAAEVNEQLRSLNLDSPGGRAQLGGGEQAIRVLGGARTAAALGASQIALSGGRFARLSDLAEVRDGVGEVRTIARLNGRPATTFGVIKAKGYSDVSVDDGMQVELAKVRKENPQVKLTQIFTSVDYTKATYHSALGALLEGSVLAVLVVFLFLRDTRATLISALAIPLSAIPTFAFMQWMDFTLNSISLLALSLVAGVLVDDAIVEIENIVRHMRMGKSPYRAALEAADEIGLAVIAISLTIIAIFAPASFMSGIAGQFFKQFGITVSVQVFFSLLAARFVTPVLAAYFLKDHSHDDPPPGRALQAYTRLVTWSVRHYLITVLIGFGIFAASIWSITLLPQGFLPAQDTARSLLAMELPPGSQLAYTEKVTEEIVARLRKRPEVRSVFVDGGRVPPGTLEVRRAALIINYTPKTGRKITQRQLELEISNELENVPDIRFWFLDENGLRAISLVVTGADSNIVSNVASELATQMKRIPIISNVISETSLDRPELRIRPRADFATRLGVSTESLSQTIRVATIGDVGPALAKFDAGDRLVPIRVQLEDAARGELKTLEQLRVPLGEHGEKGGVPLSVVADIKLDQGPTSINRYDRERQATVAADLVGSAALGDATKKISELPVMKSLPKGVKVSPSGDAESLNELSEGFATAITAGLMMVYAVLVLLFGTFLQPITILFSLPLSIGGAIAALLLTGKQLTTPVWIGILMLMGIVTKNAIMLVEFAVESIREGKPRDEAIIDAGMKRARPIVMTTVAMAAGMMPSALAFGAGGEFRSPMALAVIGGLVFSTILSLVFVPAMFMMMDDIGALIWRFGKKLIVSTGDEEPAAHHGEPAKGPPPAPGSSLSPAAE